MFTVIGALTFVSSYLVMFAAMTVLIWACLDAVVLMVVGK